jgi:hypothetical protein
MPVIIIYKFKNKNNNNKDKDKDRLLMMDKIRVIIYDEEKHRVLLHYKK